MATLHLKGGPDAWHVDLPPGNPIKGDVVRHGVDRFRVLTREWIGGELHCEVVPIVEREEGDEPTGD